MRGYRAIDVSTAPREPKRHRTGIAIDDRMAGANQIWDAADDQLAALRMASRPRTSEPSACRRYQEHRGFSRPSLTNARTNESQAPRPSTAGGKSRQGGHQAATILDRRGLWVAAFGRPRPSGCGPTGRYHAQALRPLDCRDAGRRNSGQSGPSCADVAIRMVAARSGRPVALGRRLGSRRPLGAPRPKLGLSFAPPAMAKCTVGKRPGRTLGMARRLGSRRHLGAPGSELGLPLAVTDPRVGHARAYAAERKHRSRCGIDRTRSPDSVLPVSESVNRLGKRLATDAGRSRPESTDKPLSRK
jgi:hypothetical protein